LLLVALLAAGCGGSDGDDDRIPAEGALTIYSSLPKQGDSARVSEAVAAAQRLALRDHGSTAAGRTIKFVELDSSKPDGDTWDPGIVEKNANRAADDESTIAYLGELEFGGSAISVPVTNDKGILQISPYDTLTNLTQLPPGGPNTGPERFYPSGKRTFARLVPTDLSQAAVLIDWALANGAEKIAIVHDDQLDGRSMAAQLVYMANVRKVPVSAQEEIDLAAKPEKYVQLATDLAEDGEKRPDAVIYAGLANATATPLLAALESALPGVELYGSGGIAEPPFTESGAPAVRFVSPGRPASEYLPAGRKLLARLERELGGDVPVEALYGYDSMRIVLDAIDRAGPNAGDRETVAREALTHDTGGGPLGSLGLTREGDVSDQRIATYQRGPGSFEFRGLREPQLPPPAATDGDDENG
jgi:branched-chain amino acid transport system substrate-binding protein